MTITYLPIVGDNLVLSITGGGDPLDVIAKASVPGVAGEGRPGSLKFSALFLATAANDGDDANPIITTLKIPPGILPVPSTLAAISANNPYDYTQMLPVVTAVGMGTVAAFPTSLVDGSFLFTAVGPAGVVWAGVTGVNVPADGSRYGSIDISTSIGSAGTTLLLQLTVDWSSSITN
jgi:hypothetical protein